LHAGVLGAGLAGRPAGVVGAAACTPKTGDGGGLATMCHATIASAATIAHSQMTIQGSGFRSRLRMRPN
ncbi:MAG TPA: hypothetical protein VMW65_07020, partial [Chloroflexota bacterium]|nr:hypothetical protein [Chloroflexota bacterium]